MPGAPISRWTMAYFAASLAILVVALTLLAAGFADPAAATDPDTLVTIHLVAVGWLGLLLSGALLQFVPVLAAAPLALPWLALPALVAILAGLAGLVAGFLVLGGHVDAYLLVMPLGATLLLVGFSCLIVSLSATLLSRRPVARAGRLVLAALAGLACAILLGVFFSALLSGAIDLLDAISWLPLALPVHATFGVLGWMTLTAIAVSDRLFAMFMLAPERNEAEKWRPRLAAMGLVVLLSALPAGILFGETAMTAAEAVALAAACTLLGLYILDVGRMLVARRRRELELNSLAALASLPFLVLGMAALAAGMFLDIELPFGPTAFYLLGFGWLSGLGLAQLYKIVPFLTWLETYGAAMGRAPVPRVQDLVDERLPKAWFGLYYLSVCVGAGAILLNVPLAFRTASCGELLCVVLIAAELIRARRLDHVPGSLCLPPGTARPHLVFAKSASKEK